MIQRNKNLPLFIIDQEWIVCLDEICGFVAKFIHFESKSELNEKLNAKISDYFTFEQYEKEGIMLQIESYLHAFDYSEKNILHLQRTMKFAMKKYNYTINQRKK